MHWSLNLKRANFGLAQQFYIFCKVLLLHVSYPAIHGNKYLLLWSIQKVSEEDKTVIV